MAMPTYEIRDIPDPLWKQVTTRANEDGYPMHVLVLQLLEDYAAGRVTPTGAAPLQAYAFLKEPFGSMLIEKSEMIAQPVKYRWEYLRGIVELRSGQDSPLLQTMDAVEPTRRAAILTWLERVTVKKLED